MSGEPILIVSKPSLPIAFAWVRKAKTATPIPIFERTLKAGWGSWKRLIGLRDSVFARYSKRSAGSRRHVGQLLFIDNPRLHHKTHPLQNSHIAERIAFHSDHIRPFTLLQSASAVGPAHQFGGIDRPSLQRGQRRHA